MNLKKKLLVFSMLSLVIFFYSCENNSSDNYQKDISSCEFEIDEVRIEAVRNMAKLYMSTVFDKLKEKDPYNTEYDLQEFSNEVIQSFIKSCPKEYSAEYLPSSKTEKVSIDIDTYLNTLYERLVLLDVPADLNDEEFQTVVSDVINQYIFEIQFDFDLTPVERQQVIENVVFRGDALSAVLDDGEITATGGGDNYDPYNCDQACINKQIFNCIVKTVWATGVCGSAVVFYVTGSWVLNGFATLLCIQQCEAAASCWQKLTIAQNNN